MLFYDGYLGLPGSWTDTWFYRKHVRQSNFKLVLYDTWRRLGLISFYKPKKGMESRFLEWLPQQVSIRAMIILGIIVFAIEFTTALPYFYSILLMDGLAFNTGLSISHFTWL